MKSTIVEVREVKYQLRKLSADVSSFIYFRMMGALMEFKQAEPTAELPETQTTMSDAQKARLLCGMAVMKLSFEDLQFTNRQALQVVSKEVSGQDNLFIPIMGDNGRWTDNGATAEDASLVNELVMVSLVFSLAGFFSGSGAVKT